MSGAQRKPKAQRKKKGEWIVSSNQTPVVEWDIC
jgi:hypothetical protein